MTRHSVLEVLTALAAAVVPGTRAWAQAMPPPAPPTPPPGVAPAAGGGNAVAVVVVIVGLLVLVGIVVKLYDLKRTREADAVHLQAQVSDALLREQALFGLPVTPTARVPLLKGSPATIEIAGQVPTPEMREMVLRIVRSEALRIRPDVQIDDRMAVVPSMREHVA
jgi:hypothetical protein